jgi:mRNA interferase RelE/StbE
MADYTVILPKSVQKQLNSLSDAVVLILINALQELASEPRPNGCKKLKGREAYRIRKGNYRIIYEIQDQQLIIQVIAIGHRKDIYL